MSRNAEFPYHKGIAPMMWVLFVLSLIELIVVHIFVALKWPVIGWTLTTLSALGTVWLVLWIVSMKRLPHTLDGDVLTLKLGNMKNVVVPIEKFARITSSWEQGAIEAKGVINLAAIAHPNRCLELKEPIEKGKMRVFIRLDDVSAFDAALCNKGSEIS